MLKVIWLLLNFFLIVIIFSRSPQNKGFSSFATKSNLLGSPNSAERFLNNLTASGIIIYFLIALKLNLFNIS
uniref:Probable protein-export membrane protein SecG n=1 Tax=Biddulphiella tridens TaxID=1003022 RepID=A0A2U9NST1_9STRA|nr:preprotein translocase SecG subunit [Biddulphia tridens]AWT40139.1 preprotein translocase SecG subunit [Biddulphia tridens]